MGKFFKVLAAMLVIACGVFFTSCGDESGGGDSSDSKGGGGGAICEGTMTFDANGGSVSPLSIDFSYCGEEITLPTPTRDGYTFDYWYFYQDGQERYYGLSGEVYRVFLSQTIYAQWTEVFVITFNANGGSVSPTSIIGASGTEIRLPTPTRSGYIFNGWYSSASEGERYGGGDSYTVSSSLTMYAQWTEGFVITFDANGGSVSSASLTVLPGTEITLPTPTRSGYIFNGWYSSASGGERYGGGGDSYTVIGTLTMYAQWTDVFVITFNANGGSVSPTSIIGASGTEIRLPTPTRIGWNFAGWYSSASSGTRYGDNGSSYIVEGSLTMHAQWTRSIVGAWGLNGTVLYRFYSNGRYDDILFLSNNDIWNEYQLSGTAVLTRSCWRIGGSTSCGNFTTTSLVFCSGILYLDGTELTKM